MSLWSRITDAAKAVVSVVARPFRRELPSERKGKRTPFVAKEIPARELPAEVVAEPVSRETAQPSYFQKLTDMRTERQQKQELERIMFDDSLPDSERKQALSDWADLTGWWRPDNAAEWSGEEWKRWEEIYEPEPESF